MNSIRSSANWLTGHAIAKTITYAAYQHLPKISQLTADSLPRIAVAASLAFALARGLVEYKWPKGEGQLISNLKSGLTTLAIDAALAGSSCFLSRRFVQLSTLKPWFPLVLAGTSTAILFVYQCLKSATPDSSEGDQRIPQTTPLKAALRAFNARSGMFPEGGSPAHVPPGSTAQRPDRRPDGEENDEEGGAGAAQQSFHSVLLSPPTTGAAPAAAGGANPQFVAPPSLPRAALPNLHDHPIHQLSGQPSESTSAVISGFRPDASMMNRTANRSMLPQNTLNHPVNKVIDRLIPEEGSPDPADYEAAIADLKGLLTRGMENFFVFYGFFEEIPEMRADLTRLVDAINQSDDSHPSEMQHALMAGFTTQGLIKGNVLFVEPHELAFFEVLFISSGVRVMINANTSLSFEHNPRKNNVLLPYGLPEMDMADFGGPVGSIQLATPTGPSVRPVQQQQQQQQYVIPRGLSERPQAKSGSWFSNLFGGIK